MLQEEETADELMAVLQLLATEIEAAKRKYTPERLQVWALHASQGRIRDPDNSESECDEQPEPATGPEEQEDLPHVVLSDSGASLVCLSPQSTACHSAELSLAIYQTRT